MPQRKLALQKPRQKRPLDAATTLAAHAMLRDGTDFAST
jgi:hypothetical protein